MYCISNWYIVPNANLHIHSSGDAGAVTMSLLESDFYMVISLGCDMQGLKLSRLSCCDCWIGDQSGIRAGGRDRMRSCVHSFCEPSLIWLLPGPEVSWGVCNFPGTISRVSVGTPNVVGTDDAALSAIWSLTTDGTFNSVVPYYLFLFQKQLTAVPKPGRVDSSTFICICRKRFMRYCT